MSSEITAKISYWEEGDYVIPEGIEVHGKKYDIVIHFAGSIPEPDQLGEISTLAEKCFYALNNALSKQTVYTQIDQEQKRFPNLDQLGFVVSSMLDKPIVVNAMGLVSRTAYTLFKNFSNNIDIFLNNRSDSYFDIQLQLTTEEERMFNLTNTTIQCALNHINIIVGVSPNVVSF